jgi:hypothetical protein
MKRIAQVMCVALVLAGMPRTSWATGEKATPAEDAAYAALEAASPEAAAFEGGDAAGTLLFILVVALIAVLIYYLIENSHHHSMHSPLDAPVPAAFR